MFTEATICEMFRHCVHYVNRTWGSERAKKERNGACFIYNSNEHT